jgi:glyoxylase-like metal-dependent hydrolase (beta-lactamase superfamily II)
LPGGNTATLMKSLRGIFAGLPGDTLVIPGHGPTTTLREEKETNPYLDDAMHNS